MNDGNRPDGIAIVGMAGRFPAAESVQAFWRNLCEGREGISFFERDDDSRHVPARGVVDGAELFDAGYFGMTPREAELTDPQQRLFLECAVEALECAGIDPARHPGLIGVFAGAGWNSYAIQNLYSHDSLRAQAGTHPLILANERDYLPLRVAYKLDLRGPCLNVQAACATSLAAVCLACQSLLNHQCDAALAGGASVSFPQRAGHSYQEGGIFSPDGHCRPFDAAARGTVSGDGVAIVVLKRLADALADGDEIYAVIRGFAMGNDGAVKAGFTAPGLDGQAEVIALAHGMAGFEPGTVGFVEAHGTATELGDPIEVAALTQAFAGAGHGSCALGALKGNVGHLDTAAGVAGLIKAALAIHHGVIPPNLHFQKPNPKIDFAAGPFRVPLRLEPWSERNNPRRAGVSAFGLGGTNVHVAIEEAPPRDPPAPASPAQVLVLSARSREALADAADRLANHLEREPQSVLADTAFTLQSGRREFPHRFSVAARDAASAIAGLRAPGTRHDGAIALENPKAAFLFTGQGAQRPGMGHGLYLQEPVYRDTVDRGAEVLRPLLGRDIRDLLFPVGTDDAGRQLDQTCFTQPALFLTEYALANLWMSWGVKPDAMLGHSLGEYTAACVADVFSFEDALTLVAGRARLMQEQPPGAMLAVRLAEQELLPLLGSDLALAGVNGSSSCVVSGPAVAVARFQESLAAREAGSRTLRTSHAFHSAMMDPVVEPLAALVSKARLAAPRIPILSNVTGTWLTDAQATDPRYWAEHARRTVRFADGLTELCREPARVFLEVGPGRTLASLARLHPVRAVAMPVVASLPGDDTHGTDEPAEILRALGQLWATGVAVDWNRVHRGELRRRVVLPTYPFERKRYFIEPSGETASTAAKPVTSPRPEHHDPDNTELVELFRELSGIDLSSDPSAKFTELGFDSLLLVQAAAAIGKRFGMNLGLRDLLGELGSLEALASKLGATAATAEPAALRSTPAETGEAPLTDGQKEIWFACQAGDAASCAFNESRRLILRGTLRLEALHGALRGLAARHEALRTTISPSGETQRVAPPGDFELRFEDLAECDEAGREERLRAIDLEEAAQPFDLVHGPLTRARLVRIADQEHVLLLTIHHIACDGHSWALLLPQLAELYGATGIEACDEKLPALQPTGYARALSGRSADAAGLAAVEWWRGVFADGVPELDLPTDHPRPPAMTHDGARQSVRLSTEVRNRLRELSARGGCTLFATVLSAYTAWLARLSGRDDIVVGVPVAERTPPGADTLVGHCIDYLPLRLRVDPGETFLKFQSTVQESFLAAYEHRQCGFAQILRSVGGARDTSRPPLAAATFNLDRLRTPPAFDGLEVRLEGNRFSYVNVDLGMAVTEMEDGLWIECHFRRALFDDETIRGWLGNFSTLLEGIVSGPHRKTGELPLLSDDEVHRVLVEWGSPSAPWTERCIHEWFELQAGRTPQSVALVAGRERLTYAELDRRANRLADRLAAVGVGPDRLVAVCLDRTVDLIVALLAVLKAGGGYLPIDPAHPPERIAFVLADSQAQLIVTQESYRGRLPSDGPRIFCVDAPDVDPVRAVQRLRPSGSHLAYTLYTSGSTGRPKGVAVEHRNVSALIDWALKTWTADELRGVLASSSASFDISVFEIFVPLAAGGMVILAESALGLGTLPAAGEVTLINTVPSAAAELLRLDAFPSSLRAVNLAGEPLAQEIVEALYHLPGMGRVFDLYGPTETTVYSTWELRKPGGRATIGRPIPNEKACILDARLNFVPPGVPGELYLGGAGVSRGYLGRPELNAEKFPVLFWAPGERFHRTGDRARWLTDGRIEYLGRLDRQVKLRGHRIEPGEIEAALRTHPAVGEAAAVVLPDGGGRLVAYFSPANGTMPEGGELRKHLRGRLPEYMVPGEFVGMAALPRTASGKLDRSALPAPAAVESRSEGDRPRTPTEEALAAIWFELLRRDRVGTQDNFFEIGGHSLLATQFIVRVRDAFQVDIPLGRVFQAPTIAALAGVLEEMMAAQIAGLSEDEARRLAAAS